MSLEIDYIRNVEESLSITIVKILILKELVKDSEISLKDLESLKEKINKRPNDFFKPKEENMKDEKSFEDFIINLSKNVI